MRVIVLIASLVGAAFAEDNAPRVDRAAMGQLEAAARRPSAAFDGAPLRREGPLEILSEERDVLISRERVPARRQFDGLDRYGESAYHRYGFGPGRVIPAHTVETYGDRQTVRVADRESFVDKARTRGGRIGMALGAAALVGCLFYLGPIGPMAGFAVFYLARKFGREIAAEKAEKKPDVFKRVVNRYTKETYSVFR